MKTFILVSLVLSLVACKSKVGSETSAAPGVEGLNPAQKIVAEKLISIWENGGPDVVLGYSYVQNIEDKRGYTSGRAGFTTGTGDALLVVECMDEKFPSGHPLKKYVPGLKELKDIFEKANWEVTEETGDTGPVDRLAVKPGTYKTDWEATFNDPKTKQGFMDCQHKIKDSLYYDPAMSTAAKHGLKTALTKAVLYDTMIQHGEEPTLKMIASASKAASISNEEAWLDAFLAIRLKILMSAGDPWNKSGGRVDNYKQILKDKNLNLDKTINTIAGTSGYKPFTIVP